MRSTLFMILIFTCALWARPNLIYINADDLGWTDLAVQGSDYYETPNLDRLAASGVRFTNGYAAASNCAPSRACAMSGQWPQRHGIYTVSPSERGKSKDRKLIPTPNCEGLADSVLTLPEVLKDAGYRTFHVGKWHLGKNPLTQGFEINKGGFRGGSPSKGGYHSPFAFPNVIEEEKGSYLTDRLADEAAQLIRDHRDEPFFLHFAPYSVHTPIEGRADLVEKFTQKKPGERHQNPEYAAMVHSLDLAVGKVLDTLEGLDLATRTLIVFTSDNGGHAKFTSNAPLRSGKGSYYEGGIREPFLIAWPGQIKAGNVDDTPISNLDLFPTLVAAANAPLPKDKILDGINLLPYLLKGEPPPKRPLFWHFPIYLEAYLENDTETRDPVFRTRPGSVIRLGDWKLHHYFEDDDIELYNLKTDLSERNDLSKSHPEKATELLTMLNEWRQQTKAPVPKTLNPEYRPASQ